MKEERRQKVKVKRQKLGEANLLLKVVCGLPFAFYLLTFTFFLPSSLPFRRVLA